MADDDLRICPKCGEAFLEGQRTMQPVRCPKCGALMDEQTGSEINE